MTSISKIPGISEKRGIYETRRFFYKILFR